jgi:hypothetical protein
LICLSKLCLALSASVIQLGMAAWAGACIHNFIVSRAHADQNTSSAAECMRTYRGPRYERQYALQGCASGVE